MKLRYGLLAASVAAAMGGPALISGPARGDSAPGAYLAVSGGATYLHDMDVQGLVIPNAPAEVSFDYGWIAGAAGGVRWESGLRTEFDFTYRHNDADSVTAVRGTGGGGHIRAMTFMANAVYEFDLGLPIKPYIGAGVGGANIRAEDVGNSAQLINASDLSFAYQGIAGLNYALSDTLDLFVDYRYLSTVGLELQDDAVATTSIDDEYRAHSVMIGLRWVLGVTAPDTGPPGVPTPIPAAGMELPGAMPGLGEMMGAEVSTYIVYFDWDSAQLNAGARDTIAQAAASIQAGTVTRLELAGHTDRSGPDSYNVGLSQRRAKAVEGELIRLGVPAGQITTEWFGESQPRVPTADGAREPENRRVEMTGS